MGHGHYPNLKMDMDDEINDRLVWLLDRFASKAHLLSERFVGVTDMGVTGLMYC